ncbi:MAG: hypothetical protein HQM02_02040 [Magnetococcales bacterium]|nr:hypothetical protein [Magnetococcales bacterium]
MANVPDPHANREDSTTDGVEQHRRRRLLKGLVTTGAGVPLMLTLSSGAALAAASNKNCIDNTLTYDKDDYRCIANAASETVPERRGLRLAYFGDTAGVGGDDMTINGTAADNDLCLIYHKRSDVADAGAPVVGVSSTWGKDGTNVRITESCWNSFIQ